MENDTDEFRRRDDRAELLQNFVEHHVEERLSVLFWHDFFMWSGSGKYHETADVKDIFMFYVVRHGQTDWNLEGRLQGQTDIDLNQTGINQALEIAKHLKTIRFDACFSSPLKRATKTCEIIYDSEIIFDKRLMERSFGELEGRILPDQFDLNETLYGVESFVLFQQRVNAFLDEICQTYQNKNILLVTHSGVNVVIQIYFNGEPLNKDYKFYTSNCEIMTFKNGLAAQ